MKKKLLFIFLFFSVIGISQEINYKYNLPPGYKLHPKKKIIDLSYKLNGQESTLDYTNDELEFLKKNSETEIENYKNIDERYYQYLKGGEQFIDSLSSKIKTIYTHKELWYIYAFDQKLREQITAIQ